MKLLHTADWHLGKKLDDFSRIEEQKEVLEEICIIAEQENVDAVLVAGDLFDTFNPSTEAVELFYKTLKRLSNNGKCPVIAIAGNHDSPERIEAPDPLARECGIIFAGFPDTLISPFELESGLKTIKCEKGFVEIKIPDEEAHLRVLLTPYANEYRLKTYLGMEDSEESLRRVLEENWQKHYTRYCDDKGVNILISHLFVMNEGEDMPEEPDDEKPIVHAGGTQAVYTSNIPAKIQYIALGHLHRMQHVGSSNGPVYYSGSPLSYSFSEAGQDKYVLIIDIVPAHEAVVKPVKLEKGRKLIRKRVDNIGMALEWLARHPDSLIELTVVSDTYLTASERKQLNTAHPGIVSIIPELTETENKEAKKSIDLTRSMEDLFREYFLQEEGQAPNDEIIDLFTEILAEEEE